MGIINIQKYKTEANNILNNHKFDRYYTKSKQSQRSQNFKKEQDGEENEDNLSLTFTQIEGNCYCCGKSGHKLPQCRYENKPKPEWFINNGQLTQKTNEITLNSMNDTEKQKNPHCIAEIQQLLQNLIQKELNGQTYTRA